MSKQKYDDDYIIKESIRFYLSAWTKLNLYCSPQCFGHESVPSGVFVVW